VTRVSTFQAKGCYTTMMKNDYSAHAETSHKLAASPYTDPRRLKEVVAEAKQCCAEVVYMENVMIEITMTESAKIELLKVLKNVTTKSIRLIQQGFG
jgi:hypothetical protein